MNTPRTGWGYTRIRDALRTGLGVEVGRTTVANLLAEAGIEPAPERGKSRTWKQFMKAHHAEGAPVQPERAATRRGGPCPGPPRAPTTWYLFRAVLGYGLASTAK